MLNLQQIEAALGAEAAAHAVAAAELNPFGEAEAEALGSANLVYAGSFSPVHGVYALGLDGAPEERDWQQIRRFFARKEREPNYWIAPFTDPAVAAEIQKTHSSSSHVKIYGEVPATPNADEPRAPGDSAPEHGAWALAFSRLEKPARKEPDLLALTKIYQKNTRFYLSNEAASYTFFHQGIALIPHPHPDLFPLQRQEAAEFKATALVVVGEGFLPFLYERFLHEPI